MANLRGKCVVCGKSPTVKAHLFPRAIMLDIRADQPHLVSGKLESEKLDFQQNGDWDDKFLCHEHEILIGSGDRYAINFIRKFKENSVMVEGGHALSVSNKHPEKLMHFIYATVWRFSNSHLYPRLKVDIGPYSQILLNSLLQDGPYGLQAIISVSRIEVSGAGRVPVGIAPYLNRIDGKRIWHFVLGHLEFYLKTDQRPFPKSYGKYLANGNDPIVLKCPKGEKIHNLPVLWPLVKRMVETGKKTK